jgi:hypothetical protein
MKKAKWKIKIGPRWRWMSADEILRALRFIAARKLRGKLQKCPNCGRLLSECNGNCIFVSTSKHRSEPFDY